MTGVAPALRAAWFAARRPSTRAARLSSTVFSADSAAFAALSLMRRGYRSFGDAQTAKTSDHGHLDGENEQVRLALLNRSYSGFVDGLN